MLTLLFLSIAGSSAIGMSPLLSVRAGESIAKSPELAKAIAALGPFFTPPEACQDVPSGDAAAAFASGGEKKQVGLTRETWWLEVISDKENPARLGKQFTECSPRLGFW